MESRCPPEQRYDFRPLRRELGLQE